MHRLALVVAWALVGCTETSRVEDGFYLFAGVRNVDEAEVGAVEEALADLRVTVVRDVETVVIALGEDPSVSFRSSDLPRSFWPRACPTQTTAVRLEVLMLEVADEPIGVGPLELEAPALIAQCGFGEIALAEVGGIGDSGGGACQAISGTCIELTSR